MLSPEVRKGIEALLAHAATLSSEAVDTALVSWLKHQLEANDWDKQIEQMGGGPKARNKYMKPIFDTTCSVTAFDMHAQLMADGRERGLWLWLYDDSKARSHTYDRWAEAAVETVCQIAGIDSKTMAKFRVSSAMDEFKSLTCSKIDDAALLEWPAVKKLHTVIGNAIALHEKNEAVSARTPRKPDRRAAKRRQDDKTKARLKK